LILLKPSLAGVNMGAGESLLLLRVALHSAILETAFDNFGQTRAANVAGSVWCRTPPTYLLSIESTIALMDT
jgi:hypothetical protein